MFEFCTYIKVTASKDAVYQQSCKDWLNAHPSKVSAVRMLLFHKTHGPLPGGNIIYVTVSDH